ncbi:epidermal growth factor-like protein 6 isoform X2 [Amia ocellicauda]|uniref:epidermal growth factor-like protein 6 isoform X2 n=1 Tax=Amia ocellicauda TaxID=2972642 RepID=UPI003464C236
MVPLTWISLCLFLLYISIGNADIYRHYRQISSGNPAGVCRYGRRLECCYGWKRNSKGHCEALCEHGCKHGECVGPNKCKCFPGYTGKTCNQDLNECGLKPRPCEHRCMNTHGSYMCYCLNGYMLMPDGSCANSRTCAMAHCQYGCQEVHGEVRCLCPSTGLQLGPDERTCIDVDECSSGKLLCPYNRRCVNTFGSYYCKCQIGFDLKYVAGKYDCVDMDECASNTHKCSPHAECLNTHGSYKCKCKPGFRGSGFDCSAIPDNSVKEGPRILGGGKDPITKLVVDNNSELDNEQIKNVIPESKVTTPPKARQQPFDYEDGIYIGGTVEEKELDDVSLEEQDNLKNQIEKKETSPRGDVFIPEEFKSVLGPLTVAKEAPAVVHSQEEFIIDCSFEQGGCEWVQDPEDNFDWNVADHDNGVGYYMAVPGFVGERKDVGRLKLLVSDTTSQKGFCLTFNYRLIGDRVGKLRVLLDNNDYPIWEQSTSRAESWQTELITVSWNDSAPESIIFEAERGKGKAGEIGLDNVVLTSGSCQEDESVIF